MTQPSLFDQPAPMEVSGQYTFRCIPDIPHGHVWISSDPEARCQCGARRYGDAPEPAKKLKGHA